MEKALECWPATYLFHFYRVMQTVVEPPASLTPREEISKGVKFDLLANHSGQSDSVAIAAAVLGELGCAAESFLF
jgi:hypothetical protein